MLKTILLVEDNPGDAVLLEKAFEMMDENVKLEVTLSTESALKILEAKKDAIDLVLVDLKLAGVDGFGLLNTLMKAYESLPVAVLTSSAREDDRERARDLGVARESYFVKPMAIDGYKPIIKRLLDLLS